MDAHNFIDLTGNRYGRLTVISQAERLKPKVPRWLCKCDCGNEKIIRGVNLREGQIQSCGCLLKEKRGQSTKTHGRTETSEYRIWRGIKTRCLNPNEKCYERYGGRGITICDRWLNSFENFFADMGPRPSDKHTIDRIDNSKGYSPDNCRWANTRMQSRNRRNNIYLTLGNQTMILSDWAKIVDIAATTLNARHKAGWTDEEVLTTPLNYPR